MIQSVCLKYTIKNLSIKIMSRHTNKYFDIALQRTGQDGQDSINLDLVLSSSSSDSSSNSESLASDAEADDHLGGPPDCTTS